MSVHSETYSHARAHLKELLDAAEDGRPATVSRDSTMTAVVDANRLREALALLVTARAEVFQEDGGWSVMLPDLPIAADGGTFAEAMDDMVLALREYAEDWADHLLHAPNHQNNWGLVQLITLSNDAQLHAWLHPSAA
jgi:prevent-host-death family protein